MKTLRPIVARSKYETAVEKKIAGMLYDRLFKPIFDVLEDLPKATLKANALSTDALLKAIASGVVAYDGGRFIGSFSAQISKALKDLGAKWVPSKKAYSLPLDKIPTEIKIEISKAKSKAVDVAEKINKIIADASGQYEAIDLVPEATEAMDDLHGQLTKTVGNKLEIPYAITGYVADKLTTEYSENLNLYIKEWYDEEILRLRQQVQSNAIEGYRASNMVKAIQAEYGVSRNKAKFLARQETTLLVSSYRKATYESIGLKRYQWSTSLDRRVRPEHRAMHGKICRWDDATVYWTGRAWEDRGNIGGVKKHPGEDWSCRCIAKPLLEMEGANV